MLPHTFIEQEVKFDVLVALDKNSIISIYLIKQEKVLEILRKVENEQYQTQKINLNWELPTTFGWEIADEQVSWIIFVDMHSNK